MALDTPTQAEFVETPLQDVITFLKDYHKIEIQIDTKALGEAGIDPAAPITKDFKRISLRSALRLIVGDLDLTYVVRDEVLSITTSQQAAKMLSTRVYPVGGLISSNAGHLISNGPYSAPQKAWRTWSRRRSSRRPGRSTAGPARWRCFGLTRSRCWSSIRPMRSTARLRNCWARCENWRKKPEPAKPEPAKSQAPQPQPAKPGKPNPKVKAGPASAS